MTHPFRDSRDAALAQVRALEEELSVRRAENEAELLKLKSNRLLRRVPKPFNVNDVPVLPAVAGGVLWYGGMALAYLMLDLPTDHLAAFSLFGGIASVTLTFIAGVYLRSVRARRMRARITQLQAHALALHDPVKVRVAREVLDEESLETVQRRVGELEQLLAPLRDRTR